MQQQSRPVATLGNSTTVVSTFLADGLLVRLPNVLNFFQGLESITTIAIPGYAAVGLRVVHHPFPDPSIHHLYR